MVVLYRSYWRRGVLFFLFLCAMRLFINMTPSGLYEGIIKSDIIEKPAIIHWDKMKNNLNCHYSIIDDALPSAEDPNTYLGNNSIFFIETSCRGGVNSRVACSVESAARLHPNRQVNLLFISPVTETMLKNSSLLKLREFKNIKLSRVYIKEYSKDTVVEHLISNAYHSSAYLTEHASDMLRIITLHKFGGLYLDTDSMVIKNLDSLPPNFIAKERALAISSGVLALSKDAFGTNLTTDILNEINKTYKPKSWSDNGPKAIQRALQRLCPKTLFKADRCGGLKIFGPKKFYPVYYMQHRKYFKNGSIANMYDSYMHHLWNHMSEKLKVEKSSPYAQLARRFCPTIFEMYGDEFGE